MLQSCLNFLPEHAEFINEHCAKVCENGRVAIHNASGVMLSYLESDDYGRRMAIGLLAVERLANAAELSDAFGVSHSTVYRYQRSYREDGVSGLSHQRSARGGYKLKGDKLLEAQRLLDQGESARATARAIGVSRMAIDYALKQGTVRRRAMARETADAGSQPSARSRADAGCGGGIGVKRTTERLLAQYGKLHEAAVCFEAAQSVADGGVLIALPALLEQGLLEVGESVYGALQNGFFGLRQVLLTLALMALLRIRNPEQLKTHAPGELGLLLGLDRAPERKTLRRKIKEIAERGLARTLAARLARHWAKAQPETLAYLYVDGHVRPYHGSKHQLPKAHVARRRLCMDATTDTWVNDAEAQPWLFVTAEANDSLLSMLNERILPALREQVGAHRIVTLIFDREGWSPHNFSDWQQRGFDVMTYRKGRYQRWPQEEFIGVCDIRNRQEYWLAERNIRVGAGVRFAMREVRRLRAGGHQTSIVTTRTDLPIVEVASRMFARWRQENFFRYMRHEFALDHLCTYDVETADPQRLKPNPQLKGMEKQLSKLQRQLSKLQARYVKVDFKQAKDAARKTDTLVHEIQQIEQAIEDHKAQVKAMPQRVAVGETLQPQLVVQLETERKILTDVIKMIAYRTESALLPQITLAHSSALDEGRAFLKAVFHTSVDLLPCEQRKQLVIRFHSMAHPRFNKALHDLCQCATLQRTTYPGTDLRMVYEAPIVAYQS